MHLRLAISPAKIVAAYLSPTRTLIEYKVTACLSGDLPVLMALDLNTKHTDLGCSQPETRSYVISLTGTPA
jgi:hypothetical protein